MEGFFKVDVAPLPKFQNQLMGFPVEASVKFTTNGEQPAAGVAVKLANGACAKAKQVSQTQHSVRIVGLRINLLKKVCSLL